MTKIISAASMLLLSLLVTSCVPARSAVPRIASGTIDVRWCRSVRDRQATASGLGLASAALGSSLAGMAAAFDEHALPLGLGAAVLAAASAGLHVVASGHARAYVDDCGPAGEPVTRLDGIGTSPGSEPLYE